MAAPFELTFDLKKMVANERQFDRVIVRGQNRAMFNSLRFLRKDWKSKIRKAKKPSKPGRPPRAHRKGLGIKTILFAYDKSNNSGVVGPVKIVGFPESSPMPLPSLLEGGGPVKINLAKKKNKKRIIHRRIAPRPAGGPTLKEGISSGDVMDPWANLVTN